MMKQALIAAGKEVAGKFGSKPIIGKAFTLEAAEAARAVRGVSIPQQPAFDVLMPRAANVTRGKILQPDGTTVIGKIPGPPKKVITP